MTIDSYKFFKDFEGALYREDERLLLEIYGRKSGRWMLYWEDTSSVMTPVDRQEAQELAGKGIDLDAEGELDDLPEPPPDKDNKPPIKPGMTLDQIKAAGIQVDLPMEGSSGDPEPLRYADLGPAKRWTPPPGWPPPEPGSSGDDNKQK